MSKTKYNVGDTVTVINDLKEDKAYRMADGHNQMVANVGMICMRGKRVTITKITKTGKYMVKGSIFPWVDEMFVDDKKPNKRHKFKVGDVVVAKNNNGYGITTNGWMGRVLATEWRGDDRTDFIRVDSVPGYKRSSCGYGWWVKAKAFDKTTEPKFKFKVGDIVRAKKDAPYWVTREGWMGVVCEANKHNVSARGFVGATRYTNLMCKYFELVKAKLVVVKFDKGNKEYFYLTEDKSITAGDTVVVPVGGDNREVHVTVMSVEDYSYEKLDFDPCLLRFVIRKEEKPEFHVGDFVRMKESNYGVPAGTYGRIVELSGTYNDESEWLVDFGGKISDNLHAGLRHGEKTKLFLFESSFYKA